ncbi:MAG: hypothetical protein O3A15_03805 [Proteobacteria bacterium]|jgi:hypothetical protein|nr:hypothetical protein [Pseudomonadota bacterium]
MPKNGLYQDFLGHCKLEGSLMGKGNNIRGNKEKKKPKQAKTKVSATADSNSGRPPMKVGGKNIK